MTLGSNQENPQSTDTRTTRSHVTIFLLGFVRYLPIFSGLTNCKAENHVEACKEFAINLVLATSPLWLGSLIVFSVNPTVDKTLAAYGETLLSSMSNGELLIFATSAIAPIFYFSLTPSLPGERDYPSRLSHIVSSLLIFMVCTALFGAERAGGKVEPSLIFPMSICIYLFALMTIYIATVYRNYRDYREMIGEQYAKRFEHETKKSEDVFAAQVKEHRSGQS